MTTPESLCEAVNTAAERFGQFKQQTDDIKTQFGHDTELADDSTRNPCDVGYKIEHLVEEVQQGLYRHLIGRLNTLLVPNIPIDAENLLRDLRPRLERFDAFIIFKHFQQAYVRDAAQKSLDAIHAKARRLLPRAGWNEETNLQNVVKKNVLTLHKYIRADCGGSSSFERNGECDALQKFVRVILEEADPVTVDAGATPISAIQSQRKYAEIFDEITFPSGWIQKVRFHRNGKMLVTMKGETSAQRVAQALFDKSSKPV